MGIAGDIRLDRRHELIVEAIARTRSLVVREVGGSRADEVATHRFLGSRQVTPEGLLLASAERTAQTSQGRAVVAVQDTTEINFAGRSASRRGLGPGGDGASVGFFIHPVIAVDVESEAVLGLVGSQIWTRDEARVKDRRSRVLSDKESQRWLTGARLAASRLAPAASVLVVSDQESDIYELFARKPEGVDLLIRARHQRRLADGGMLGLVPCAASACIKLAVAAGHAGEKDRVACLEVGFKTVVIQRPATAAADVPASLELFCVETREINDGPLAWRLLTSKPTHTAEEALDIIRLYRLRWRIEEVFRLMKRDGLALEDSQIEAAPRLFNLAALALQAAVRILQLVDARDGSARPATDVVDHAILAPASAISKTLEGKTLRQKNPHPPDSLAWLSWIVARLGGWNCYYKPPGPKTMARGWKRFEAMIQGYLIATGKSYV